MDLINEIEAYADKKDEELKELYHKISRLFPRLDMLCETEGCAEENHLKLYHASHLFWYPQHGPVFSMYTKRPDACDYEIRGSFYPTGVTKNRLYYMDINVKLYEDGPNEKPRIVHIVYENNSLRDRDYNVLTSPEPFERRFNGLTKEDLELFLDYFNKIEHRIYLSLDAALEKINSDTLKVMAQELNPDNLSPDEYNEKMLDRGRTLQKEIIAFSHEKYAELAKLDEKIEALIPRFQKLVDVVGYAASRQVITPSTPGFKQYDNSLCGVATITSELYPKVVRFSLNLIPTKESNEPLHDAALIIRRLKEIKYNIIFDISSEDEYYTGFGNPYTEVALRNFVCRYINGTLIPSRPDKAVQEPNINGLTKIQMEIILAYFDEAEKIIYDTIRTAISDPN